MTVKNIFVQKFRMAKVKLVNIFMELSLLGVNALWFSEFQLIASPLHIGICMLKECQLHFVQINAQSFFL